MYYSYWVLFLVTARFRGSTVQSSKPGTAVPVRISTGVFDRTIEAKFDEKGNPILTGGIAYQNLKYLTQKYNYEFVISKFYRPAKGESIPPGNLVNGSWSGVMGDLTQNISDIGVAAIGARATFSPYAEITFPWAITSFSMYIPYPQQDTTYWAFLKPFSLTVWLLLLISLLTTAFTLRILVSYLTKVPTSKNGTKRSYGTLCMSLVAVLTGQGGDWNYSGKLLLTLGMTWCLSAVVIVNAYNGLLTSYLLTSNPKPIATSLEDLVSKTDVPFYTFENSWVLYIFKETKTGTKKTLGDGFRKHPERILPSYKDCLGKVAESQVVCFSETFSGDIFVQKRLEKTGECQITNIARELLEYNPIFLMQKNSLFFPSINNGVIWAHATGLQQFWSSAYTVSRLNCEPPRGTFTKVKKLTLQNLSGPFLLLVAGYLVALIVFAFERIFHRFSK